MFQLYAEKTQLEVWKREAVTSGSVNVYQVRFEFSGAWEGLERMAVFRGGGKTRSVLLDETNKCVIPWEVLQKHNVRLEAGVYGTLNGDTVLPTVWADLGTIHSGVTPGEDAMPPTPNVWRQELDRKQDKLTGKPGQVVGFDEDGNAVPQDPTPVDSGGDGGGTACELGHGLKVEDGKLTVATTDDFTGDNTLPMTAAGVQTVVGNIDVLLGTI